MTESIKFTPASMVPTAWQYICPVCNWGHPIEDDTLEVEGFPLEGAIFFVSDASGDRWFRCDNCDTLLEGQRTFVNPRHSGGVDHV